VLTAFLLTIIFITIKHNLKIKAKGFWGFGSQTPKPLELIALLFNQTNPLLLLLRPSLSLHRLLLQPLLIFLLIFLPRCPPFLSFPFSVPLLNLLLFHLGLR